MRQTPGNKTRKRSNPCIPRVRSSQFSDRSRGQTGNESFFQCGNERGWVLCVGDMCSDVGNLFVLIEDTTGISQAEVRKAFLVPL